MKPTAALYADEVSLGMTIRYGLRTCSVESITEGVGSIEFRGLGDDPVKGKYMINHVITVPLFDLVEVF